MGNKNRLLKIILTRGIAPSLYICLSDYFAGGFEFQIFRFILGVLWVIFLIILMSLRLVGYGKFESVMPFIIKMVTASLIIIFVERKILKLSYDKYYS